METSRLASRAMLVSLKITGWGGKVYDRNATEVVARSHNAATDAGRYTKSLLHKQALAKIAKIGGEARAYHYEVTMPWTDGQRLLPVTLYDVYRQNMDRFQEKRVDARNELVTHYDMWLDEAKERLGDLFNPAEYPSRETLATKYEIFVDIVPVPDEKHFIADLAEEEKREVQRSIQAQVEARLKGAVGDLYERVHSLVELATASLDKGGFTKPLMANIQSLLGVLPGLNITNDSGITVLLSKMHRAVEGVEAEELRPKHKRYDPDKRARVANAMNDLRSQLAGYFGDQAA